MIVDFSVFENDRYYNQPIFKKGDLIKSETYSNADIYLILNDVYPTDERADAFYIGFIDKYYPSTFSFNFNEDMTNAVEKHTTRNWQLQKLKDSERQMILDELNRGERTNLSYDIKKKLKIIEEMTGFDIKKLPELVNYQVITSSNKYNL
jgi:hypothetical protein